MQSVGSYLSREELSRRAGLDPTSASVIVLKELGPQPKSFAALLSATAIPEAVLRQAIERLRAERLVDGNDGGYVLTDLGYKAQFVVAS